MANTRKAVQEQQKPKRIPMGRRNTLQVYGLTDTAEFKYRFFNDIGDRLFQCLDAGYEFVNKDGLAVGDSNVESARGTESVVKKGVGMGVTAYLMRIPMELYLQDRLAKDRLADEAEAGIKAPKVDGSYGSVKVEQTKNL